MGGMFRPISTLNPSDPKPQTPCAGCGVDGVKVDVQGSSGMFGGDSGGGPRLSAAYHRSLEASVADAFPGNTTINCMVCVTSLGLRISWCSMGLPDHDAYWYA